MREGGREGGRKEGRKEGRKRERKEGSEGGREGDSRGSTLPIVYKMSLQNMWNVLKTVCRVAHRQEYKLARGCSNRA